MAVQTPTPTDNTSRRQRSSLSSEVVVANQNALFSSARLILPWSWDDLTREFGVEIYRKMLLDAQVNSCVALFKASIIEDGLTITSSVTDKAKDGYKLAQEISDKCNKMFGYMETSLDDILWDMMDDIVYGSRVAEQTYEQADNMLNIKYIKPKPIESIAYVVDEFLNVVGLVGVTKNNGLITPITGVDQSTILPRKKFLIFTFRSIDNNPRGVSILRPAYDPWWRKRQTIPEQMKFLAQFAVPSIIGSTPENVEENEDAETDSPNPQEELLAMLLQFRNASAMALPFGTTVDFVKSSGDGQALRMAITDCNMEITKAILTQELATEQSKFQARAAAQVHQGILDTLIRQAKRSHAWAFRRDVIVPWVTYNWGPKVASELCPIVTFGTTEQTNLAPLITAIAALERSGFISDEQRAPIDKLLGLPIRTSNDSPKPQPVVPPAQPVQPNNGQPVVNNGTKPTPNGKPTNSNDQGGA